MNKGFPSPQVDLDRLRAGPVEWSGGLADEPSAWGLNVGRLLGPPRLEYRAESAGSGGIRVTGRLEARLGLTCRRCLRDLDRPVELEFDFRFDPAVQPWDEQEAVYGLDAEAARLDLFRPLREQLILALPEFPECSEGCAGLCPMCGADLGETDCDCSSEEQDLRWNVLRELVPDGQSSAAEPDEETDGR